INQKNSPANSFQPTNFFEGGINLTNLKLAGACFSSFLLNTRASASGDAELHDKVIGQFGRCAPSLATQASTNATVTPGTPVTDSTTECFDVAKIPTDTVTTPVDGSGTPTSTISLGSSIYDRAVVTGTSVGGDPTGTVTFSICEPIATGTCTSGGTQVGSAVTLTSDGNPSTYTSNATSIAVTPDAIGRYCFRG